jgi:small-conductance mechanosensitive channel
MFDLGDPDRAGVLPASLVSLPEVLETIATILSHRLLTIGGNPLTVGTILISLLLIVVGWIVSRHLSRGLGRVLGRRFHVEPGQATAIQTLSFYLLFVAFAVTALRMVNFPLTVFTIAGGAVAIGVGFGSQNLMNNFISGLILLLERPVRVGDLVEVEGTYGTVEHIGARSTRILTLANTHIIVPNSFLLQTNVANYTLADDVIRTSIKVGVVYGSPTRKVEQIIRQVVTEHPKVLREFEPRIVFSDFGDNSLDFHAYFSLRARTMIERRLVESEIRFRIDDLFREAGIVIAFPQRDVHLDSVRPIDVRLVGERPHDDSDRPS